MSDQHSSLEAAITARLDVARAAAEGGAEWRLERGPFVASFYHELYSINPDGETITSHGFTHGLSNERIAHIALHDPADAILRYERDLRVAERHRPLAGSRTDLTICGGHPLTAPVMWVDCPESTDLLTVYPEATP